MNPLLLCALNRLADETRAFLHDANPELERWEALMIRRAAILAELEDIVCSADELAEPEVVRLKREILQQETLLQERAFTQLASVGAELRMLESSRRALRGYEKSSPSCLFERNA